MKRKLVLIIACMIVVVIAPVLIWQNSWRVMSQDGATDPNGVAFWMTTWKSLGAGGIIEESGASYSTSEDAHKHFEEMMQGGGTIIERNKSPENAPEGSERVVRVFGDPERREGVATIIRIKGNEINYVRAGSLKSALSFERGWFKLRW